MTVPFVSFDYQHQQIAEEAKTVFAKFFHSNHYVLGNMTQQFEQDYAAFNKVAHCVGISNGLDALHLALKSLGIGSGDEVIVPSNTYIATALAVEMAGAKVVFCEPDPYTYNLDPRKISEHIKSATKAIMPVHLYGQACEMDELMSVARQHGLFVIEDNAQAHGATFKGKLTGSFGQVNATSFYPTKNLGALGEAGAITTDDFELAQSCKMWRNYGSEKRYYNKVKGVNNRIDELQAGLLSLKLKYLDKWTELRKTAAKRYIHNLAGCPTIQLPTIHPHATHVFHLFVITCPFRDELQQFLGSNGVSTVIHYPIPPHLQEAYAPNQFKKGQFPIAERLAETCLSLPIFPGISPDEIDFVSDLILKFKK